jgi:hypothetical protein
MKPLFIALTLAFALVGSGTTGLGADTSADAPKAEKKGKHMPFKGTVSAVDKVAMTITLEGKEKARVFAITSQTRISKEGNPAVVDDIKVGESVGGQAVEAEGGKWDITTLNLGKKSGETKSTEKKTTKKAKAGEPAAMP